MNKSYGIYLDFLGDDLTRHSSRNIESEDFSGFIRYCALLIRVGTVE